MGLLILNSRGINTVGGVKIIRDRLESLGLDEFKYNKIFVVSYPYYEVDEFIINNLVKIIGFEKENIYLSSNGIPEGIIPDFVYVTEGNTFEILKYMRLEGLFDGTVIPHYEPDQLERYLSLTEEYIKSRYKKIISVGNDDVLTIKV